MKNNLYVKFLCAHDTVYIQDQHPFVCPQASWNYTFFKSLPSPQKTTPKACVNTTPVLFYFCFLSQHSHFLFIWSLLQCPCPVWMPLTVLKHSAVPSGDVLTFISWIYNKAPPWEPHWYFLPTTCNCCLLSEVGDRPRVSPNTHNAITFGTATHWIRVGVVAHTCGWDARLYTWKYFVLQWTLAYIYQWMLRSLTHWVGAKLSCCNEVSVQVSVRETLDFVRQQGLFFMWRATDLAGPFLHSSASPSLSLLSPSQFFLFPILISFPHALLCFHSILLAPHGTQGNNGSLTTFAESLWTWWLSNVSWENNTKGQFSIFTSVRLRFADTSGLIVGPFIMQAMLRMT